MQIEWNKMQRRRPAGNIIALACVVISVLTLLILVAYSFAGLVFVQNRLQTSANEIALAAAKKLNYADQLAQMNQALVRCRQLVYASRRNSDRCNNAAPELASLAARLASISRQEAQALRDANSSLARSSRDEARSAVLNMLSDCKQGYDTSLPWLCTSDLSVESMSFGRLKNIDSSAVFLSGINALAQSDLERNFIHSNDSFNLTKFINYNDTAAAASQSGGLPPEVIQAPTVQQLYSNDGLPLYLAETNLNLPVQDSDLRFELSSLPAAVGANIAAPRVVLPGNFIPMSEFAEAPSSVIKIDLSLRVSSPMGIAASTLYASGLAITTGASPRQ